MKRAEIFESFQIAFDSLKANKLRSFLASLGVVIGIAFVIIMGWVLSGLDKSLMDTFNMIGTDMLYVDKYDWAGGKNWKKVRQRKYLSLQQVNEFRDRIKTAELTFISARNWGTQIKYGNEYFAGTSVVGTTYEHSLTPAGTIEEGRHFTMFESQVGSKVIVLGHKVAETVFPDKNPIGEIIKIDGHKFEVIGVIKKQGTMWFDMVDNQSFIPLKAFLGIFGGHGRTMLIGVKAGSDEWLDQVRDETRGLMRQIRNIRPGEDDDFSINETKAFQNNVETLRLVVGSIGIGFTILSFIVGIIGIMNIMFVSVAERTKEIGIRKAVGAKKSSILIQFIIESASLCLIGALIAFVFCSVLVYLVATVLPEFVPETSFLSQFLPYQLLFVATLVSIIVGVLAGLIPAVRAANLDPVDSLRYE